MQRDIDQKFVISVTKNVCYRARARALKALSGSLTNHYKMLSSHVAELKKVYKHGLFSIMVEGHNRFKRMFVGFDALKEGFLGGCFLKSEVGGQLLSVVGRDGNNQIFPVCWDVVEGENEDSWRSFLIRLTEHLGIVDGFGLTIISDQQKGLQNAVRAFMPNAEHRNCARHLYANWKKKHVGYALKNLFWKAAKSTTEAQFNEHMYEMKVLSQVAHDDFIKIGSNKFCRFKISTLPKCEIIDNNMFECFNGYILRAKNRLLIDMLEDIRRTIMKTMAEKRETIMKSDDTICPKIRKNVEENKIVRWRLVHYFLDYQAI
ncbi:hypothetical protein Cni_G09489 [Canna indica]|uniref:MULE transposase domain-containing protein n=1 Tax=Canna indica TaxID=4628 RepID=A0AAQ3K857_9LILI|nr:hypothetical protein Cni_G09489 [Canna indica]